MKSATHAILLIAVMTSASASETNPPLDLSQERVLYEVGYPHLDTQWHWAYPQVIREFLPATVHKNVALLEKYPNFIINFTGAGRYQLIKEYHPDDFALIRKWVGAGRWFPSGSSWEENDMNVPACESVIRQLLLGHGYFKKEFGTESSEYMLPDCFGFPASLPSILAHCGLRGFSTSKLGGYSAVPIPFNVGEWIGPDGNSIIAALKPEGYGTVIKEDRSSSPDWLKRIEQNGARSGVFADYTYFGTGDKGGAPPEESVKWIEKSVASAGAVRVICGRADQMFNDITDAQKTRLPKYQGDLLLREHSAGSITSQAYMKHWNHQNELLADAAERAAVAAHLLGAAPYPREKLTGAWELVLRSQQHDMLAGTCDPKIYEYTWNDEIIALNSFADVLQSSVGAVARGMDTRTDGTPLVVYNPLSIARQDVVEAALEFSTPPPAVQVFDGQGTPVPTQVLSTDGNQCHFLFLAQVQPVGFAVFSVKTSAAPADTTSALRVSGRSLENDRYRVTLDGAGDIAGIFDKQGRRELLSSPARLEFVSQNPKEWPAWNMSYVDQTKAPRGYVDGPAEFRIVESGPVRVAISIRREAEGSVFTQTIRLSAGSAGERVEVANQVDWQSKGCSLKAAFPLMVSNQLATYNWDIGKIQRANNEPAKFEVPSHQWFDLTDASGCYGVSILTSAKYGSDKPSDDRLRLTLLYTPGMKNRPGGYNAQHWQDWGRHEFVYGIYGHCGDWRAGGSDWQAARLDQPLLVFRTVPHDGELGRSFSLLRLNSDDVAVRAIKLAEEGDQVIVRLQELKGTGQKSVKLDVAAGVSNAVEVSGLEKSLHPLAVPLGALALDFKPYQIRSLALTLKSPATLPPPVSTPVELPYNLDAFGFRNEKPGGNVDDTGSTIPAEMIGDTVVAEGVTFHLGPRETGLRNAVACEGQVISLPAGRFDRLYLLAAAVGGDTEGTFAVDGRPVTRHIQNWTGYIGSWDNRVFKDGDLKDLERIDAGFIKRDPLAWYCSHRHLADGTDAIYSYSYLFKYQLDLPPGANTLTLPDNPHIRVCALTLAAIDNGATQAAYPLYDDFTNRKPIGLRDGWKDPQ
jgi:alpha-mannosidase